jgi:hypothetical protein
MNKKVHIVLISVVFDNFDIFTFGVKFLFKLNKKVLQCEKNKFMHLTWHGLIS